MQIWVDADACPQVIRKFCFGRPSARSPRAAAMRNLMQDLRSGGELLGGPVPFRQNDQQLFANQLGRFLTRRRDA
jgi:uncharacterized protein YaiI (UPF0178 family)